MERTIRDNKNDIVTLSDFINLALKFLSINIKNIDFFRNHGITRTNPYIKYPETQSRNLGKSGGL